MFLIIKIRSLTCNIEEQSCAFLREVRFWSRPPDFQFLFIIFRLADSSVTRNGICPMSIMKSVSIQQHFQKNMPLGPLANRTGPKQPYIRPVVIDIWLV